MNLLKCHFEKGVLTRIGSGDIIVLFAKTPTPRRNTDVVCPHFYELKWAYGCPYNCDFCYLKGTFRFMAFPRKDRRVPPKFKPRPKIEKAMLSFINCMKEPAVLNSGELGDSLMGENLKPPFSEFIMNLVEGTPHKILFLSKGTYVRNFVNNDWQKNAILSWSINSPKVSKRYEKGSPNPLNRIEAARLCYEAGYTVRFRLDPMVPVDPVDPPLNTPLLKTVEEWEQEYGEIIDKMFEGVRPDTITLGTLRGLPATRAVANQKEWTKYLDEKSNWGLKPNIDIRFNMFKFAIKRIRKHSRTTKIGICKDTLELHKMLQKEIGYTNYRKMECNCL